MIWFRCKYLKKDKLFLILPNKNIRWEFFGSVAANSKESKIVHTILKNEKRWIFEELVFLPKPLFLFYIN